LFGISSSRFQINIALLFSNGIGSIFVIQILKIPKVVGIKIKKTAKILPAVEQKNELAKKAKFKKDFKDALSIEEARALSLKHVRSLWKK
jgi:hypothetical protein